MRLRRAVARIEGMRQSKGNPLPLVVLLCAVLSGGLILWSRNNPPPAQTSTPAPAHSGEAPPASLAASTPAETPAPAAAATPADTAAPGNPPPSSPPSPPIAAETASSPAPVAPPPSDAELAGPLPTSQSQTPNSPAASPPSAPAPATELNLATLAQQPQLWPQRVTLAAAVRFPVFINGVEAGNMQVPRGTPVSLRKVQPDGQVEIEYQNSRILAKAEMTDLQALLHAKANQPAPSPSPKPADTPAQPAPDSPAAQSPSEPLTLVVKRDRKASTWLFHIQIQNRSAQRFAELHGRLFVFSSNDSGALTLAANQELRGDVEPNGSITLEPGPLSLDAASHFDSYAVVLRDANGTIVGSSSTRESATRDWAALEIMLPGTPLPNKKPGTP